ncbi:SGNH/GDSL hydrolase family protein [Candidatus Omnitrophota bacterium]
MLLKRSILTALIALLFLEGVIALMLLFPALSKFGPTNLMKGIYHERYREIIQFEPNYAHYDPKLTYTLRPGNFLFSNAEFTNQFQVNKLGVRDDKDSLDAPEIVVIGDSLAMGWGVNQNETYAQLIEQKTKIKVLNAAISSYGTVREIRMLDRVDTTRLKILIIHFLANDTFENLAFYYGNNRLAITDKNGYKKTIQQYQKAKRYYPGKYSVLFFKALASGRIFKQYTPPEVEAASKIEPTTMVKLFLNTLINAGRTDLSDIQIIVIGKGKFISRLNEEKKLGNYPQYIKEIKTVDLSDQLNDQCYYLLDEHFNAAGHRIIADLILAVMREGPLIQNENIY